MADLGGGGCAGAYVEALIGVIGHAERAGPLRITALG
jgi:hypothetical protein